MNEKRLSTERPDYSQFDGLSEARNAGSLIARLGSRCTSRDVVALACVVALIYLATQVIGAAERAREPWATAVLIALVGVIVLAIVALGVVALKSGEQVAAFAKERTKDSAESGDDRTGSGQARDAT